MPSYTHVCKGVGCGCGGGWGVGVEEWNMGVEEWNMGEEINLEVLPLPRRIACRFAAR